MSVTSSLRFFIFAFALYAGPAFATATGAASLCAPVKECGLAVDKHLLTDATNKALASQITPGSAATITQGGAQLGNAASSAMSTSCAAHKICSAASTKCKPSAAAKCTVKDCASIDAFVTQMTAACYANTQAVSGAAQVVGATTSGIGTNTLMAGAAGLAVGVGAMALINKDKKKDPPPVAAIPPPQAPGTAPNAALDCAAAGSETNAECNADWEAACKAKPDDAACQRFAARYCDPAQARNGVASAYCKSMVAVNYCKTAGRTMCPSCLQIEKNRSPACANNPALCQAQYTTADLDRAKAACPTDPAFADPNFAMPRPPLPGTGTPALSIASVGSGPRPDIGGQYGNNLFSISSGAIRARCRNGQLNNCK